MSVRSFRGGFIFVWIYDGGGFADWSGHCPGASKKLGEIAATQGAQRAAILEIGNTAGAQTIGTLTVPQNGYQH